MAAPLRFAELRTLRTLHPSWRLMAATNAPMVMGFLHQTFTATGRRRIPESEMLSLLEDHLQAARTIEPDQYPESARAYLQRWRHHDYDWVRATFAAGADEPVYDLTAAAERALEWVSSLQRRTTFIGTKSRMKQIIDLLKEIRIGTESDPEVHLKALMDQRAEIELAIRRISDGDLSLLNAVAIKERFQQVQENAQHLLTDLRGVEQNFRMLDQQARKKISTWDTGKGALLAELFAGRESIQETEQGQSFVAFWDFLMSPDRQGELSELLERALRLPDVQALNDDPRFRAITSEWIAAADAAQRTVAQLSQQLRRFLDDRTWVQNRAIVNRIQDIERFAIGHVEDPPDGEIMNMDGIGIEANLPMDRPLFRVPHEVELVDVPIIAGEPRGSLDALYSQVYVDPAVLRAHIADALVDKPHASLLDILTKHPLQDGLAEVIGYLQIAHSQPGAHISDAQHEIVTWITVDGVERRARVPFILFAR